MNINSKVILNLENLFEENYKEIKYPCLSQWLDFLTVENPDVFSISEQKNVNFYDKESLNKFKKAKKNIKLLEFYETLIEFSINETEVIDRLSKDLKSSFEKIKKGVKDIKDSKIQIILLTYSHEPYAWISGFGEGDYPILNKPEHFDFNYQKDFFEIIGNVDYSYIWDNLLRFEESLEETEIFDDIFESDFYQNIRNSYIFKTYLLLNKAFSENKKELFNGLNIKKPLFIYGNEHDCEKINIYSYE